MLLELTLSQDDEDFGQEGDTFMLSDSYIVGVARDGEGSKLHVDMSDTDKFKTIFVKERYELWYELRLNPKVSKKPGRIQN